MTNGTSQRDPSNNPSCGQPLSFHEFLAKIPKADIHYHLLGGVRMTTMQELAAKYGIELSESEAKSYYRAYIKETGSTKGGIEALTFLYTIMQQAEDYARVLLEVAEDAHACGVRYIETFWNPSDTELRYDAVTSALVEAIDEAERLFGIIIRLIPSINREKSPEDAVIMVEQMIASPHEYVLGIGIDYKEHNAAVEQFWKAYALAKKQGYRLTAHCSEFGLHWRNVETGVDLIGVDRIDHGYSIVENPTLCAHYAKKSVPFTVVPSNTYFLQQWPDHKTWCENHPIRTMAQAGLMIIPCTDDWHMHNTDSTNCYRVMVEALGFDVLSLQAFMRNSLLASWLDPNIIKTWLIEWESEFHSLLDQVNDLPTPPKVPLISYRSKHGIYRSYHG